MKSSVQRKIQDLLNEMTESGVERGVQVAVYHHGDLIVDAWSGVADCRSGRAVDGDSLFPIFSVSKGMAATVVHQIVERGLLSYDRPIADVWPEFAANGKEKITLRQALNHSSGIPHVPQRVDFADLADWNKICAAVADLTPVFPAGSRAEYHAITFGWIVGEVACRVDGRSFPQLLKEGIADPLGLDGVYIGIPEGVESRVAFLEDAHPSAPPADPLSPSSVPGWIGPLHAFMNRPDMQRACIPASSGIMSARAMAKHYAALLPGGVDGVELLPPARVREATAPQGLLNPEGNPSTWGLGYHWYDEYSVPGHEEKALGHGGFGGSLAFGDPGRRLAVGITKNRLNSGDTAARIFQTLIDALEE